MLSKEITDYIDKNPGYRINQNLIETWLSSFGLPPHIVENYIKNEKQIWSDYELAVVKNALNKTPMPEHFKIATFRDLLTKQAEKYTDYKKIEFNNYSLLKKLSETDSSITADEFKYADYSILKDFISIKYSEEEQEKAFSKLSSSLIKRQDFFKLTDLLTFMKQNNFDYLNTNLINDIFTYFQEDSIGKYDLLLDNKLIDIKDKTLEGDNILHYISRSDIYNKDLLDKYINLGVGLQDKNIRGTTPLDMMVLQNNTTMLNDVMVHYYSEGIAKDIKFKLTSEMISYSYSNEQSMSNTERKQFQNTFKILKDKHDINNIFNVNIKTINPTIKRI